MPESIENPQSEVLEQQPIDIDPISDERLARPTGWDDEDNQLEQPPDTEGNVEQTEENPAEDGSAKTPAFSEIGFTFHGVPVQIKTEQELIDREEAFQRSKSMQGDYTRKTQALAQERNQLSEISRLVGGSPELRQLMVALSNGTDFSQAVQMVVPKNTVPEQYVTHPETGQIVPNVDYLIYMQQKGQQPVQDPRVQQQLDQQQQMINAAIADSGNQAGELLIQQYGVDFTKAIYSKGTIYSPDMAVDEVKSELQRMFGPNPNGIISPQQIVQAFERSFPDVVDQRRRTDEARTKAKNAVRPGVTPPQRANATWLSNGQRGKVGGTPDAFS